MASAAAVHEASHAVAAWSYGLKLHASSVMEGRGHAGMSWLAEGDLEANPLHVAATLLSGEIGEKIYQGRPARFNWLRQHHDADSAGRLCDSWPDPLKARRMAELMAESLLRVRWKATGIKKAGVRAIASPRSQSRW